MITAYKLLSFFQDTNTWWSYNKPEHSAAYGIEYKIGEIVKPEFGRLFVFDSIDNVLRFTKMEPDLFLWEVECDILIPQTLISYRMSKSNMKNFWLDKTDYLTTNVAPFGSHTCNWLKLKRIITEEEIKLLESKNV